jgi:hypothetical protein
MCLLLKIDAVHKKNNFQIMLDGDNLYIKVVELEEIYNFVVDKFFI